MRTCGTAPVDVPVLGNDDGGYESRPQERGRPWPRGPEAQTAFSQSSPYLVEDHTGVIQNSPALKRLSESKMKVYPVLRLPVASPALCGFRTKDAVEAVQSFGLLPTLALGLWLV